MSAWTQLIEPGPALLILFLSLAPQLVYTAPFDSDQSTEIEYYPVADATGCYYNFEHYNEGDRIITNEPCLNCTCHNRMLMCYLRVCPFTKAIGQNCKVEKKSDQCCPVITCPEVHVQLLPQASTTPSTQLGHPNEYGCTIDNLFYADGAKVPSNPNNPCEVCYCIRNKTACIIQDCTLTGKVVEGCRPVYVDGVCCPVRYDCDHPELETTPRPLLTTTTTTLPPTSAPTDCIYNNEVYADGALVKKDVPCEQCYCMRGDIVCAVQECGPTPLDKVNCTALPTKEGQCCPDTYECENLSEEDLTTLSYYEVPTTQPSVSTADEDTAVTEDEREIEITKTPTPQVTLSGDQISAETEGRVSESITTEESPVTESITVEAFTSKISEAVDVVTTKVTEIVEAITSTIIGKEQETTSQPDINIGTEKEFEASTTPVQAVGTDTSEQIIETASEEQQPVTVSEEHTDHGEVVTEGVIQETKAPESDDQKLPVTAQEETEDKLPATTESLLKEQEPVTELVAHDDHEDTEEEESHEDENEVIEGSGMPAGQEAGATLSPQLDTGDKHTRPIDQSEIEVQSHTTEHQELETTRSPIENELIEGSKEETPEPVGTLAPESETEGTSQQGEITRQPHITEQPEVTVPGSSEEPEKLPESEITVGPEINISDILTTEISVEEKTKITSDESITPNPEESVIPEGTKQPGQTVSSEYCNGESCQQTTQSLESEISTTKPEIIPEVETTITEKEEPHTDVPKQPEEGLVTEESETKLPKDITTTENIILLPEKPSVTESIPVTDTQRIETEVTHEEQKPATDGAVEDGKHVPTQKGEEEEEMEFLTEIPTKETEKPQSMDHVSETISPVPIPVKPDDTEKSVETQTTERDEFSTELPKQTETMQPDIIKPEPEYPVEIITDLSENRTPEVITETIPGITEAVTGVPETPVICDNEHGCVPGQEENNEIPDVSCTKENCASQGHVPHPQSTETNVILPSSVSCESEHDCAPTTDEEGIIETNKVPEGQTSEGCDTENGCISLGSDKTGHIPEVTLTERCESEHGCIPAITEKEIEEVTEIIKGAESPLSESCNNELGCTPIIPEKEGPVTEETEIHKLHESATSSDETVTHIPQEVKGTEQPPIISEITTKPEELEHIEGSGQEIQGPEYKPSEEEPEETDHTEGSGQEIEGSGQMPSEETESLAPELVSEAKPEQATETAIVHDEQLNEITDEIQPTETEQIVTVTPMQFDLEKEIEPESTSAPEQIDYDKTQTPGDSVSEGTQSPEFIAEGTLEPEHNLDTQSPEIFTHGTEVPQEILQESVAPEVTTKVMEAPEELVTEGTELPRVTEPVPVYVTDEATQSPVPVGTQSPDKIYPEGTNVPEIISTSTRKTHKEIEAEISPDITETPEDIVTEGSRIPGEVSSEGTQLPDIAKPEGTPVPYENLPESTHVPEHVESETAQAHIPESTEVPEEEISVGTPTWSDLTESPEKITSKGTQSPENINLESTQIPKEVSQGEQFSEEITESATPEYVVPSGTKSPEDTVPEGTHGPQTIIPEGTLEPEQILPENTQAPAQVVPESTESTELIVTKGPDHAIPETTQHLGDIQTDSTQRAEDAFEGSQTPETVKIEEPQYPDAVPAGATETTEGTYEGTQVPEQISPEGTVSSVDLASEDNEIPESTQIPQQIIPEATYTPAQIATGDDEVLKVTQSPEEVASEGVQTPEEISEQILTEGTQAPERISPEDTKVPEEVTPQEISTESTHVPEHILPEGSQAPDYSIEVTATPEQILPDITQIPEEIAPEGTQHPEHTATDLPEFQKTTQTPVQAATESETESSSLKTEEEEHGIPGEGSCLVDGLTYKNNSRVPPINQCQTSCRCVSSILQCESVSCTPPPNNLQDCMPIFHSPDSCCPIYSCSVPGVTSMESDSHVVETTTVGQEEEKPITIGIQVIPGEEATRVTEKSSGVSISSGYEDTTTIKQVEEGLDETLVTEKSSGVSISSEDTTTIKQVEEGLDETEETEIKTDVPKVSFITEISIADATTPKVIEEETTQTDVSKDLTTEDIIDTEVSVTEGITKESPVPESGTSIPGIETSDILTEKDEIITIEPPVKPIEEEHPEQDAIENEISEIPIVSEHCGVEGCVPVLPTEKSQVPEKPVTEVTDEEDHTISSMKGEITEKQTETYTDKAIEGLIGETQTNTAEPVKDSDLLVTKISAVTEQSVTDEFSTRGYTVASEETSTDKELPGLSSTVIEQLGEEEPTGPTENPKISDDGVTVSESSTDSTKIPDSIPEIVTEVKPSDGEHVISELESPVTERTQGEITTESIASEVTFESATEAISEETKTPEELAAIPEMEEVVTVSSILPESITEIMTDAAPKVPTERMPESIETEQPIISDQVVPEAELPVSVITTDLEKLDVKPEFEITTAKGTLNLEEGYTEPQLDKVTTAEPSINLQTGEPHETLQTTSVIEHITESEESVTSKAIETAAHVTEVVEEEGKKTVTPITESPESTSKESVEESVTVPEEEVKTEIISYNETKPEEEAVTESSFVTLPYVEQETITPAESEEDKSSTSELATISTSSHEITEPTILEEKETDKEGPVVPVTEGGITIDKEHEEFITEGEKDLTEQGELEFPTHAPLDNETGIEYTPSVTETEIKQTVTVAYITTETPTVETVKLETEAVPTQKVEEGITSPQLTTQSPSNASELYTSGPTEQYSTKKSVEGELSTSATPVSTVLPSTSAPTYAPAPVPGHDIPGEHVPELPDYQSPVDDYEDEDQSPLGPGTCRYGGKVYVSAQQIPRDDPCDFCFCFRSDIICLQQSCPPPIPRCHEEPIRGFCCPRYECPVGMATAVNVTTSTTTTTTMLPPHFLSHAYKGRVTRSGCQIKGRAYQVGAVITNASGPCLHCTCGGDGEMKCDPKACSPEPMLRQMIAAAASRRRR